MMNSVDIEWYTNVILHLEETREMLKRWQKCTKNSTNTTDKATTVN